MVEWQKYIETFDANKKVTLKKVFYIFIEFINFSQNSYKDNSLTKLYVNINDQSSYARYSNSNICIDSGLIKFAEEVHLIFFDENPLNEESYAFILWSIAHELAHHLQNHQEIQVQSSLILGLEFDADRVAIKLLFNYLIKTKWAKHKTKIDLKIGILSKFYIPFRLKSENSFLINNNSTHPNWALRLLCAATFLAYDGNQSILCEESKTTQELLFKNINSLELFYKNNNPNYIIDMNIYKDNSAECDFVKVLEAFEKIRQKL